MTSDLRTPNSVFHLGHLALELQLHHFHVTKSFPSCVFIYQQTLKAQSSEFINPLSFKQCLILYLFFFNHLLSQDRQQQVKHLMPIKTYIAECLDKIQGVIRGTQLCINSVLTVLYLCFVSFII